MPMTRLPCPSITTSKAILALRSVSENIDGGSVDAHPHARPPFGGRQCFGGFDIPLTVVRVLAPTSVQNIKAFTDAVQKAKPAGAKGTYVKRVAVSARPWAPACMSIRRRSTRRVSNEFRAASSRPGSRSQCR